MSDVQYIQDSLALRIDDERIPFVAPPVPEQPKPRAAKRRLQDARSHGMPELKRCRVCNEVKSASEFTLDSASRDGLWFRCAECNRAAMRERYQRLKHTRSWQERHLRDNYGITMDQYEAMFETQGSACAVCKSPEHGGKNWHVDHDHVTGKVRGLLCNGCNTGIGGLRDDPEILRAAADYVERHC